MSKLETRQMMQSARLLVIPLLLAIGGCGSTNSGNAAPAPTSTTNAAPAAAPAAAEPIATVPATTGTGTSTGTSTETSTGTQPNVPSRWGALFVAGDHSITAFDNATRRFYNIVQGKPRMKLARLTSDPSIAPSPNEIATLVTVDEALGYINNDNAENCLVFLTSHGKQDGFLLSQHDGTGGVLPPRTFDWLLDRHCGTKPTVAIISACYSGIFLEQGMEQPNRIILTAARRDRTSFGCSADEIYTYYDKCLLDSWLWAYSWRELYDKTSACVAAREAEIGATPSEPQAFFGSAVTELPMP
jgi:hypothetical protein